MKRSDKFLLAFFIFTIGLFGVVHLDLYARYKQGNFTIRGDSRIQTLAAYQGAVPGTLCIYGNLNVRIVPSDTFAVKWDRLREEKINFRLSGDSLIFSADSQAIRDPHNQWQQYDDFPWVYVYCGSLKNIQLTGAIALMKGTIPNGHFQLAIGINNTQLLLGRPGDRSVVELKEPADAQGADGREFFDSLDIHTVNSNLVLNKNTVIHALHLQLDDRSELNDLDADIDDPIIHYGEHSRITLNGAALQKLK